VMCTNRDLPLQMTLGTAGSDFTLESGGAVQALRCVAGPTRPRAAPVHAQNSWRLLSHLSLNYLSLTGEDGNGGPEALRQILGLYADINDATVQKQIDGLRAVESQPIVRRLPSSGPITFGRGLEISLTCDESAYEATGAYLFGAVLEEFLARYVSLNSFTETVLRTTDRGEVMRWPARIGRRHRL
jgi:type VI secretion system protein ImpG